MREADVAVVGAGPAGIAAALAASGNGARVALIDEDAVPGGHLRWSLGLEPGFPGDLAHRRGFEIAARAIDSIRAAGVDLVHGVAWGLFGGPTLAITSLDSSWQLRAEKVVITTGSTDIVWPFPGWELPGVMTTRAARRLVNLYHVLPGRSIALVGEGADAEATVDELRIAGASVIARFPSPANIEAGGEGRVEWIQGGGSRMSADCVVMALGRQPDPELAVQVGCEVLYSDAAGGWIPRRTAQLESTIAGVYVAGEAAGARSAAEAFAEGTVAGEASTDGVGLTNALEHLGSVRSADRKRDIESLLLEPVAG